MTGRDILCAIAGIDDGIVLALGQFSAVESSIKDDQKRMQARRDVRKGGFQGDTHRGSRQAATKSAHDLG